MRTTVKKKRSSFSALGALSLLVALVMGGGGLLVLAEEPAEAAFPGFNGRIAFISNRTTGTGVNNPEGDYEIFTMKPDGTGLTQLTTNTTGDYEPAWSAGGTKIVFTRNLGGGNYEVYTMDADGSNPINLTNNAASDSRPDWQPFFISFP
jgi:Tol biopolymer transport system component